MAAVSGSSIQVYNHSVPAGVTGQKNSSSADIRCCFLSCVFTGTYAQADNATIAAKSAIESSLRDGKTVTLIDAAFAALGYEGTTAVGAKTVTVSGANITCELTTNDLSTEHGNAALSAFESPLVLFVSYSIA